MKLCELNGFEVHLPESGGKAGKGHNKTSTIQLRRDGCIVKQFRFVVDSQTSRVSAMRAAKEYALTPPANEK